MTFRELRMKLLELSEEQLDKPVEIVVTEDNQYWYAKELNNQQQPQIEVGLF